MARFNDSLIATSTLAPFPAGHRPLVSPRLIVRVCLEDLQHVSNRFWVLMRAVIRGNDMLALCVVHMRAPIRDDSVGHDRFRLIFVPAFTAVSTNHVVGNSGSYRNGIECIH